MKKELCIRALLILGTLFLSTSPILAIKHCHDYTAWAVTGNNFNDTPPNALRTILKENKYEIAFTTTAGTPGGDGRLRPGDVVFFGDAHSGIVNSDGRIDHFLQNMQQAGRLYDPSELPSLPNFYRGWTMVQFANQSREIGPQYSDLGNDPARTIFPFRNMRAEVWRKNTENAGPGSQGGVPMIGGTWDVTVTVTGSYNYKYRWLVTRGRDTSTISWRIKQLLTETNDPNRKQLEGQTWDDSYFEFKDGVIEYNRARGVYSFSQWATCNFKENAFECTNGQQSEFGRSQPITIEGTRTGTPPREGNPASNAMGGGSIKVAVVGDAEITRDGQTYKLTSGMMVSSGDWITTGMDSRVNVYFNDNLVEVSELTSVRVENLRPENQDDRTLLWLKAGEVSAEINGSSRTQSDFSVKSPIDSGTKGHHTSNMVKTLVVTANQSGTRFGVHNNQQTGIATVSVTAGAVTVATENGSLQSLTLGANQRVEVTRNSVSPITSITTAENRSPSDREAALSTAMFRRRDNMTISPPAKILRYFGLQSEEACKSSCAGDPGCVAYTFVRPGGYQAGDPPMCYLMSSLGPEVSHSCCVSGFKGADSASKRDAVSETTRNRTTSEKNPSGAATTAEEYNQRGDEFLEKEQYDKALEAYTKAVKLKPIASAYYHIGVIYNAREDWKQAVTALQQSLKLDPTNAESLVALAFSYHSLQRYSEALDLARRAIALKPDNDEAYFRMGWIYNDQEKYSQAIEQLREAIRLDPEFALAHFQLGYAYQSLDRLPDAIQAYRTTIRLAPDDAEAYHNLGMALVDQGNRGGALEQYRILQRLNKELAKDLYQSIEGMEAQREDEPSGVPRPVEPLKRNYDTLDISSSWDVRGKGNNGVNWRAMLDLRREQDGSYSGYFDWTDASGKYAGREQVRGTLDTATNRLSLTGFEAGGNIARATYTIEVTQNGNALEYGKWSGSDGGGAWNARKTQTPPNEPRRPATQTESDDNKCIPFHGVWNDTSFGTVITFQRNGNQVTGRYVFRGHDSSIRGVVSGTVLEGEYFQPTYPDARYRRGRLRFVLNPDGRTWSGRAWDSNGNDEQAWNGACPRQ